MFGQRSGNKIDKAVFSGPLENHLLEGLPNDPLISLSDPVSPVVEQYRRLFSRIDNACKEEAKRVIAVTSSVAGEGKTTTISNLALIAARDFGKKVLLIDAHFRNPMVANYFNLKPGPGLFDVMMHQAKLENVFVPGGHPNLTLMPAGQIPPGGKVHLVFEQFKEILLAVRNQYHTIRWEDALEDFHQTGQQEAGLFDYVLVDAPPVIPMSQIYPIAEAVDGIVFVVSAGVASKQTILQATKVLNLSKIICAVLNRSHAWPLQYPEDMYYGYYSGS
ncbi:MAG: CpsD/CapB family tyrosine-protein kinase [Nitrospirota bacterium]